LQTGALNVEPTSKEELLAAHHEFPGPFRIKAIGETTGGFSDRVVAAATGELGQGAEVKSSVRDTSGGRHQAVTLDLQVQSPEQVLAIYAKLRQVEGLTLLL
jgi:hypothetical protein